MLLTRAMNLFLFWGIWLLVPLLVDGLSAVAQLISIISGERSRRRRLLKEVRESGHRSPLGRRPGPTSLSQSVLPPLDRFPLVTVIVPVHNSSQTVGSTLESLARQTYPTEALEIICVDNGSTDDCFQVFSRFQERHPRLRLAWIPIERPGKAAALNAGIYSSAGVYIMGVDADVRLAPDAIYEMVRSFEFRPNLVAATGAIAVAPPRGDRGRLMALLHTCEAFEYLSAFGVGRRYQSHRNALYTLSGAFSAFRREVLLESSYLFDNLTVSEDTKLTFDLRSRVYVRRPGAALECVDSAVAFVHPIPSLAALYSQRLRWQRGQVEVAALHSQEQAGLAGPFRSLSGRILLADHTLAFPRLVWTFLLPFLFLVGYSPAVVLSALAAMYLAYVFIECLFYLACYHYTVGAGRRWLRKVAWVVLLMPLFRFMVYWFRLGGILHAVAEPQRWHTPPFRRGPARPEAPVTPAARTGR